jgi:hypothetical protein
LHSQTFLATIHRSKEKLLCKKVTKNAHISQKFSGHLRNTSKDILCFGKIFVTKNSFHKQRTKQLIVPKSAAAVKEEKHKNEVGGSFRYKSNCFLNIFALDLSRYIRIISGPETPEIYFFLTET